MRIIAAAIFSTCFTASAALAAGGHPPSAAANAAFLARNAKAAGVVSVPGIQYQVLKRGRGPQLTHHDCVTVTYKGTLIDGTVFDATKPGEPRTFPAGELIPGWVEALTMMHAGDKWRLVIPSGLAYGAEGAGGVIPPNQTLVFELELLKVSPMGDTGC